MTGLVESLEEKAYQTHQGKIPSTLSDFKGRSLREYSNLLRVDIKDRIAKLEPGDPKIVLDLGSGDDAVADCLNRLPGVEAFCLDIDPEKSSGLPSKRMFKANMEELNMFPSDSIDYIVSSAAIYHADMSKTLKEVFRVLSRRGKADIDLYPRDANGVYADAAAMDMIMQLPVQDRAEAFQPAHMLAEQHSPIDLSRIYALNGLHFMEDVQTIDRDGRSSSFRKYIKRLRHQEKNKKRKEAMKQYAWVTLVIEKN